jgi:chromosomal replication initiator protein
MDLWSTFKAAQKVKLPQRCSQWLDEMKLVQYDGRNLKIEIPSPFLAAWFDEHILSDLENFIKNSAYPSLKVEASLPKTFEKKNAQKLIADCLVSPLHTLEQFICESDNILLKSCLQQYEAFFPIVICGPKASGKTHLLGALYHEQKSKGKNVLYLSAEAFQNAFIRAIRTHQMPAFKGAFHRIDALFIDDVHMLGNKPATLEALFHLFNAFHERGAQLFFTSNCPVQMLDGFESRLISRLQWGLLIQLPLLSRRSTESCLQLRGGALGLSPEIVNIVAQHLEHVHMGPALGIQALEGLALETHLSKVPLSLNAIEQVLHRAFTTASKVTASSIILTVCEYYGLSEEELLSKSKARLCSVPRKVAMYLCKEELKLSLPAIGKLFCRDHSTVISSIRSAQQTVPKRVFEELLGRIHKKAQASLKA